MRFAQFIAALIVVVSFVWCVSAQNGVTVWQPIGPSANPAVVNPAKVTAIANLAANMYSRWQVLNDACDPRAVFAVAYLFMTHNARKLIENRYFDSGDKMADFILNFASRYTYAFDTWASGNTAAVSLPWAVYFTHAASNHSDVTEDITIGMNAHINYDLAIAAYETGYAVPQWAADYYRINDLMYMVDKNVTVALGRYDPLFYNTDPASQAYFQVSIDLVTSWRSDAYAQAVAYQNAPTSLARAFGIKTSETTVGAAGQAMAVPFPYRTDTSRVAYCRSNYTHDIAL